LHFEHKKHPFLLNYSYAFIRLLATLGEYLFYAATQVDEDPSGSAWRIDSNCLNYLLHLIRNTEEDEIVRFYACKTIENIAS